jgi:cholesterol transport system auxiliary component
MSAPPRRPSRRLLAGAIALASAGCAALFASSPPRTIYRLRPVGTFPPDLPSVKAQLLVDPPTAPDALDKRRIALTRSTISIDYFADVEWDDSLPAVVQTVLENSFENSRAITAINDAFGLRPDFTLGIEIRHFEAQYTSDDRPPDAWVALTAKLIAMPARLVVAQAAFEQRATAERNHVTSIVRAFDRALGTVASQIVVWTLTNAALSRRRGRL